ncbi:BC1872 family protein [Priestia megaterium]|uniref:BC1872 family protein n=1 Tax=Priestia megaterium TaxID=1404 RepID=UPI003CFF7047
MIKKWSKMSNQEKNLIIARDVLKFDCFNDKKEIEWYDKHYSLGHWRYCTDLKDAIDLSKRVLEDGKLFNIIMSKNNYECHVISSEQMENPLIKVNGQSLPEVICLASLYLKGINVS